MIDILVEEGRERKKTILIATHDLRILDRVDGVIYLDDGEITKIEGRCVQKIDA